MKEMLDPKIKKDHIKSVQDLSSDGEDDKISKLLKSTLNQVLNGIDQSLRNVPYLIPKNCPYNPDNGEYLEENTTSLISEMGGKLVTEVEMGESSKGKTDFNKDNVADEIPQDSNDVMKDFEKDKQERENDHFKFQSEHINQINHGLMQANKM